MATGRQDTMYDLAMLLADHIEPVSIEGIIRADHRAAEVLSAPVLIPVLANVRCEKHTLWSRPVKFVDRLGVYRDLPAKGPVRLPGRVRFCVMGFELTSCINRSRTIFLWGKDRPSPDSFSRRKRTAASARRKKASPRQQTPSRLQCAAYVHLPAPDGERRHLPNR